MFIPVIEETMVVKKTYRHYDETNSIIELIKKEVFGLKSKQVTDEDDDQPLSAAVLSIKLSQLAISELHTLVFTYTVQSLVHSRVDTAPALPDGFLRKDSPPPDFC